MMPKTRPVALLLGLCLSAGAFNHQALAAEAVFVAGRGHGVDMLSVGIRTPELRTWNLDGGGKLSLLGEATLSSWHSSDAGSQGNNLVDIGLTPMLRYFPAWATSRHFYLEAGAGVHGLSRTTMNSSRTFSTAFQFGEFIGGGVEFCPKGQCSLGLRLQHVSNGGLKEPNDGISFGQMIFGYRF